MLRLLGHRIGKRVRIGFSWLYVSELCLGDRVQIGHLNLVLNKSLELDEKCKIGYLNILKGPFEVRMKKNAAIGNKNYFTRAPLGVSYGKSTLFLGEWTKITVGHHLDLTRSVRFGNYSILAGLGSQLWTHGYYHADEGLDRIRIDGSIQVGDNVYIGSSVIFNPGVKVGSRIHIGAGAVISKDLKEPGMYVNQSLRYLDNNLEKVKTRLIPVKEEHLIENVYRKK
ncbi:acyltransferase [Robiginitalea sp. IMCC44478]|uniref:acyltransferase n=1 Tax=Robiginitalea sp. IMCC44478 TaxID=3459122 RepID=UPI0040410E48